MGENMANISIQEQITDIGNNALRASRLMTELSARQKKRILTSMATELEAQKEAIQAANALDIAAANANGLSAAMVDRLTLTDARFAAMAQGVRDVAALRDPVGKLLWKRRRPNGIVIEKRRVPLGVVAIIFESRPNVTADAAVLCIKTSNAVILRGGKEAFNSNRAIAAALAAGGARAGLPAHAVQLVNTTDRDAVRALVQLEGLVDVVIPRGGESLIRAVVEHARIPVLKHYKGVCHLYVDAYADIDMALRLAENAKCQRPGVCNAIEKLLVHKEIAHQFLPRFAELAQQQGIEVRADSVARAIVPAFTAAQTTDWTEEYLELIIAVKIVDSLIAAIDHINQYGSHHSDAIVTGDTAAGAQFLRNVDSAAVYVNASTRFTDGGEFGMGAEMGISTDKLHARGPMGLEELTTYKYCVTGTGQSR